jgi:hypothetical protein
MALKYGIKCVSVISVMIYTYYLHFTCRAQNSNSGTRPSYTPSGRILYCDCGYLQQNLSRLYMSDTFNITPTYTGHVLINYDLKTTYH